MQRGAIVFLILLRLAIGWHFLYEGLQKVRTVYVGETVTNRPFSSAGYLRESTGPLGGLVRWGLGDPDEQALALLVVQPAAATTEPATQSPRSRIPAMLARDWDDYLARYEKHYALEQTPRREEAKGKLDQAEDAVVLWLVQTEPDENTPEQKKSFPSGDVLRKVPTAERIQEYRNKRNEVREALSLKMWLFGRDTEKARLPQAKVKVVELRTGLLKDLDKHTQALTRSLNLVVAAPVLTPLEHLEWRLIEGTVLLDEGKAGKAREALEKVVNALQGSAEETRDLTPLKPEQVGTVRVTAINAGKLRQQMASRAKVLLSSATDLKDLTDRNDLKKFATDVEEDAKSLAEGARELPEVEPLPDLVPSNRTIEWVDWLTRWGLTVIGACLLMGLFTRTSAWLAAGFLLMTYLAMPAFPWLPAVGPSEGNYLFVNKNMIELLALCVLATTATGRWFGVDSVISWFGSKKS
jgi:uncharacterized membrane protein YphA (DoxX/SURF4 family)